MLSQEKDGNFSRFCIHLVVVELYGNCLRVRSSLTENAAHCPILLFESFEEIGVTGSNRAAGGVEICGKVCVSKVTL